MADDPALSAPLFAGLPPATARTLAGTLATLDVPRGDVLFTEGEPGDCLFVLRRGKVKLGLRSNDGRENLLAVVGPGEMLGELSLFDPGLRTSTATVVADAQVLRMGHDQLAEWLATSPAVAEHLLRALAQRLRRTNEALADLVFSDVTGRVAKALIDLATRFGQPTTDGVKVAHDLTQEELAQLVGASRESVNKALADFNARGWTRRDRRAIVLLDVERIERRAR
jgi:CRP-like cAMP-binding protein